MKERSEIAIVLLAAGASRRLGEPKQLLHYDGSKLIERAAKAAAECGADRRLAVLGADHHIIRREIKDRDMKIVVNKEWEEGMASSIRSGLESALHKWPSVDAILFMLCDQPSVDSHHLDKLITRYRESGAAIVASSYDGISGVPAIFDRTEFPSLMKLKGDKGAQKMIAQNDGVANIPLQGGAFDIDSKEDIGKEDDRNESRWQLPSF